MKSLSFVSFLFTFMFVTQSTVVAVENLDVIYRTHVEKEGWQNHVSNGAMSGTQGKARRLESIDISIPNTQNGGVTYRTHVQTYGWIDWVTDGMESGTTGEAKRLEAIELTLTGSLEQTHDIYYRVHAQKFGWLDWAKNGQSAGTAGFAYRLEGIEIQVLPKGSAAPGPTARPFVQYTKPQLPMKVNYSTHIQSYGWQSYVSDGQLSGTYGQAKRLEGIKINLANQIYSGGIEYQTHIQSIGWQDWKSSNVMSGTSGQAKRLEAIRIRLTGELANYFDVYYRVHAQSFGWMGWAKNGDPAGTSGFAYRLEGINIQLVPKGNAAPGSTANAYQIYTKPSTPAPSPGNTYVDGNGNGLIKGSVNYIYHVPESKYYNVTTNVQYWFKTVDEAIKAGYRAPQ